MYYYTCNIFYGACTQEIKMAQLFMKVPEKENKRGACQQPRLAGRSWKGDKIREQAR